MSWTNVAKPTGPTYTNVNGPGKESYDQSDIAYDSSTTYYDGVNPSQWTGISKPVGPSWTSIAKPT